MGLHVRAQRRERWQTPQHEAARGGKWLKTTLVQAAWAAIKVKGSYLQAQSTPARASRHQESYRRVGASMLTAAWHMLRDGIEWTTSVPLTRPRDAQDRNG